MPFHQNKNTFSNLQDSTFTNVLVLFLIKSTQRDKVPLYMWNVFPITKCLDNPIKHFDSNCSNTSYLTSCIISHQHNTFGHCFLCWKLVLIRTHMKCATWIKNLILARFGVTIKKLTRNFPSMYSSFATLASLDFSDCFSSDLQLLSYSYSTTYNIQIWYAPFSYSTCRFCLYY